MSPVNQFEAQYLHEMIDWSEPFTESPLTKSMSSVIINQTTSDRKKVYENENTWKSTYAGKKITCIKIAAKYVIIWFQERFESLDKFVINLKIRMVLCSDFFSED